MRYFGLPEIFGDLVLNKPDLYSCAEDIYVRTVKLRVTATVERVAYTLHQRIVEIQVVYYAKSHSEHLACLEKVTDVGSGVRAADGAVALLVYRARICKEFFI